MMVTMMMTMMDDRVAHGSRDDHGDHDENDE